MIRLGTFSIFPARAIAQPRAHHGGLSCAWVMAILCVEFLSVAFVVLKLIGRIEWSWWWVLSPIWIHFLGVMGVMTFYAIYDLVFE